MILPAPQAYNSLQPPPCLLKTAASIIVGLSITLLSCFVISAHAQMPEPMQRALMAANINPDNVSLIITPVSHLSYTRTPDGMSQHSGSFSILENILLESDVHQVEAQSQPHTVSPANSTSIRQSSTASTEATPTAVTSNSNAANRTLNGALEPSGNVADQELTSDPYAPNPAEPLTLPIRHNPDIPRTPASTMKLIPTFVALDLLGANFTWFTHVYHTGYIAGDTLYGDLIIQGSGDPKLTHKRLTLLLAQVQKNTGIQHIKGDIILDTSIFQGVGKDPAAFDNDPLRPYNASPDGLLINFNTIELSAFATSHDLASVFYTPMLANYDLPKTIALRNSGNCNRLQDSIDPLWQTDGLRLRKRLPRPCNASTFYIAYPDVKDFARRVVKQKWLGLGNTLSGNVISTEQPLQTRFGSYIDMSVDGHGSRRGHQDSHIISYLSDDPTTPKHTLTPSQSLSSALPSLPLPIVSFGSLPLSQQIYDINHYSNNVMTEQLLLSMPVYLPPNPSTDAKPTAMSASSNLDTDLPPLAYSQQYGQSDYTKAIANVNKWWQTHLTTPPPNMTNGSGLCRECTVTADNLAELLEYAYHHPDFDTYVSSLGIAGVSGTIKAHAKRLPNSAATGRAFIKTGTLDNVTAMAGYVHGTSGQDYVVVGIINSPDKLDTNKARYALDTMLDWTAKH